MITITTLIMVISAFAAGAYIGSDAWPPVEERIEHFLRRSFGWRARPHRLALFVGSLMFICVVPFMGGQPEAAGIPHSVYLAWLFSVALLALGITAWLRQLRRNSN